MSRREENQAKVAPPCPARRYLRQRPGVCVVFMCNYFIIRMKLLLLPTVRGRAGPSAAAGSVWLLLQLSFVKFFIVHNALPSYHIINGLNDASRNEIGRERVHYSRSSKCQLISQCRDGKYYENAEKSPCRHAAAQFNQAARKQLTAAAFEISIGEIITA